MPALLLLLIAAAAFAWLWLHRFQKDRLWWSAWAVPAVALAAAGVFVATDLGLQKALGLLLMPAGLAWLALIATVAAALAGRHWRTAALAGAALVLWTAAGNVWLGSWLVRQLEAQVPPAPTDAHFDAVLVLGGGSERSIGGEPQAGASGDRLLAAAALVHAGRADRLVASGWSIQDPERNLGEETRTLWQRLGVPATAIEVLPEPARITREEIAAYRRLVAERGWTRVGLLTSAWHLPRALALCDRAGLAVTPIACDSRGRRWAWSLENALPREEGFTRVQLACWEMLGRAIGR